MPSQLLIGSQTVHWKFPREVFPHGRIDTGLNLRGGGKGNHLVQQGFGLLQRRPPNDLLHSGDGQWIHAKLIQFQSQQDHGIGWFSRHLSAHRYPDPRLVTHVHDLLDQAQYAGWRGYTDSNPFVDPVNRQNVLNEIIGSDTEEIHFLASSLATITADGTSIMTPISISFPTGSPLAKSSSFTSKKIRLAVRISSIPDIIET